MEISSKAAAASALLTLSKQTADDVLSFLKPGQTYTAKVAAPLTNGILTLSINLQLIKVLTDLKPMTGELLKVIVETKGSEVALRLLSGDKVPALQQALREVVPNQQPLQGVFKQLAAINQPATPKEGTALPPLPPKIEQALSNLIAKLPSPDKLTTPDGVKNALANSGLFMEAQLQKGDNLPQLNNDLKTQLLRLAALLRQTLTSLPSGSTAKAAPLFIPDGRGLPMPTTTKRGEVPSKQSVASPKQGELLSLLQLLGKQTESALARVQMNQLNSLQLQQQQNEPILFLEIPLFNGKESETLELKIEKETKTEGEQEEGGWSVTLKLDSDDYGPVRAIVTLKGKKVATTFWCEQAETQQYFHQHLSQLSRRIEDHGLTLERIQALTGRPPEDAPPTAPNNLIDTQA